VRTDSMDCDTKLATLRRLVAGCSKASALMPWGSFGPARLPEGAALDSLLRAHILGLPADLEFAPLDKPSRTVRADACQLAALTPDDAGACHWLAVDLDAAGHGESGLLDCDAAGRAIAERCDALGIADGLLVARSRSGAGRHAWLLLDEPAPLADAALVIAYLASCAARVAGRDVDDYEAPHAFRSGSGIAAPGQPGAFELLPRSSVKPRLGYPLVAPFSGAAAKRGGGIALDPFTGEPLTLDCVPCTRPGAFARVLAEARAELERRKPKARTQRRVPAHRHGGRKLDARTEALLSGAIPQGERNRAVYYGVGDLLRAGRSEREAEAELLAAAERAGLQAHEARATIASGLRRARGRAS
jgi:hypothetical protein